MLIYVQTDSGPRLINMAHVIDIAPQGEGCSLRLSNEDILTIPMSLAELLKLVVASGFTITYAN